MKVREWMSTDLVTAHPEEQADGAWIKITSNRIRQVPVLDGEELVGILSRTDLLRSFEKWNLADPESGVRVKKIMTADPETTSPSTAIEEAALRMYNGRFSSLPVKEEEELVGILTRSDMLEALMEITGLDESPERLKVLRHVSESDVEEFDEEEASDH